MTSNRTGLYMTALGVCVCLTGCQVYRGPASPYAAHYGSLFEQVALPEAPAIEKAGTGWTFSKPIDEVWTGCLRTATQYEGILRVNEDDTSQRRLLFVHGQEMQLTAPGFTRNSGMVFAKFLDTWIAVALRPEDNGRRTTVTAAYVSPETGQPVPFGGLARSSAVNQQPGTARTAPDINSLTTALFDDSREIAAGLSKAKEPAERRKYVPQATINEFFYHLGIQLYGPERWRRKFSAGPGAVGAVKPIADLQRSTKYEKHAELEQKAGNWASARLRATMQVVHCPEVGRIFEQVVGRLKQAAGKPERQVRVYVIASPQVNAFALPNGDLFICSALLEALASVDEVAAVLGHELDHVLQHDTVQRLEKNQQARDITMTAMYIGAIAGGVGGAAVQLAVGGAAAAAGSTIGTSIASRVLGNLASSSIQLAVGAMGQSIGTTIVSGYSQKTELRADYNGARHMHAAGYEVQAALRMLAKLKDIKVKATKRREPIASGFINCKPGLDKRTEQMREAIAEITAK